MAASRPPKLLRPAEDGTTVSFKSSDSIKPQFGMRVAVMGADGNYWSGSIFNVNQPNQFITIYFDDVEMTEWEWRGECTDPNLSFPTLHENLRADSVDPECGMCAIVKDDEGNSHVGTVVDSQPIQFITIGFDDGATECEWDSTDPNLCFLTDSNGEVINDTDMTLDVV